MLPPLSVGSLQVYCQTDTVRSRMRDWLASPDNYLAGPLTVFIPLNILTGVLTFVWPFARTKGQFILISAIYAYVFLHAPPARRRRYFDRCYYTA